MQDKVNVLVFGIKDQSVSCGCSGDCGPSKTMGDTYEEFVRFLSGSRQSNRIDINFVDILMDNMEDYGYVIKAMEQGYGLPITAINGKVRFYGGISGKMIYRAIMNA